MLPGPVKTSQKKRWPPCTATSFASHVPPPLSKFLDPLVVSLPAEDPGENRCKTTFRCMNIPTDLSFVKIKTNKLQNPWIRIEVSRSFSDLQSCATTTRSWKYQFVRPFLSQLRNEISWVPLIGYWPVKQFLSSSWDPFRIYTVNFFQWKKWVDTSLFLSTNCQLIFVGLVKSAVQFESEPRKLTNWQLKSNFWQINCNHEGPKTIFWGVWGIIDSFLSRTQNDLY